MKHIVCSFVLSAFFAPLSFASDFSEPFEHIHRSKSGAAFTHSFGIESAFTGRDLFVDYAYREGNGEKEHETELELEWAFTKRLGVILELPYIWASEETDEGVERASGLGDLAIVPRALLVETDHFLLTFQTEVKLPTGSSLFGGKTALAPGVCLWNDLGNGFTLNSAIAMEREFDSDVTALELGAGLVKSFAKKGHGDCEHAGHSHKSVGMLNFHLEVNGSSPLNGEEEGDVLLEGITGISYSFSEAMDVRAGYLFPITRPTEFDKGFTAGLIFHF